MLSDPDVSDPLKVELGAYRSQLKKFLPHAGEYIVMQGVDPLGFYASYEEALDAGYDAYGDTFFLVKQVVEEEKPHSLPICSHPHASPTSHRRNSP